MYLPNHINPIIKLTETCNYNCYFCRYANHRQTDDGISVDIVKKIIHQCAEYNSGNNIRNMNIIFHGGEPLLYDIKKFESIMEYERFLLNEGIHISNSIQTNASMINNEWLDFFAKNEFSVGISLDGPLGLNGHIGTSATEAEKCAVNTYHRLREKSIDCGFLCVITQRHLSRVNEFFDFFIENNVHSIGLCYCYNKIDNENVNPVELGEFLKELYDLYFFSSSRINIREFDMATRIVLNRPRNECAMSCRKSCGNFLTLTPEGNVEFCDDYDLNRTGILGNINYDTIIEMLKSDVYQEKHREAVNIVDHKCEKCEVFHICKSGCMRNDTNKGNYFCETYKIIYPYIEERVKMYLQSKGKDINE